jgi:hypothetical protein
LFFASLVVFDRLKASIDRRRDVVDTVVDVDIVDVASFSGSALEAERLVDDMVDMSSQPSQIFFSIYLGYRSLMRSTRVGNLFVFLFKCKRQSREDSRWAK